MSTEIQAVPWHGDGHRAVKDRRENPDEDSSRHGHMMLTHAAMAVRWGQGGVCVMGPGGRTTVRKPRAPRRLGQPAGACGSVTLHPCFSGKCGKPPTR